MSGTLYGVGVGPGDPELMTVKAWRLISTARVIAYLAANGGESTAKTIALPFLPDDAEQLAFDVPMRIERDAARGAYDNAARMLADRLAKGHDVIMLCEGDPFFYGSFMYVFERLTSQFPVVVVPGVTSLTAAAAASQLPLAGRDDVVKVLPATLSDDRLREELITAQAAAIIKAGRHFGRVKRILSALDLVSCSTVIVNATRQDQRIHKLADVEADAIPYFSTILVRVTDKVS